MTNPFFEKIPVLTTDLGTFIQPIVGNRGKDLFKIPTTETKTQVKEFLRDLHSYDQSRTVEGAAKLNNWLTTLELNVVRAKESADDLLIFTPKRLNSKGLPAQNGQQIRTYKMHAILVWRMGKIQTAAEPNNPVRNIAWVQEHEGTDGTFRVGVAQALELRGKFGIINPVHSKNLANLANAAHSDKTIYTPMLEQLREIFPAMPLILTHGMSESPTEKLLIGNNYGRMINTGTVPSFGTLLAIALALQEYGRTEAMVTVQSILPDVKVIRKGKSLTLCGNSLTSTLRYAKGSINTNVSGHAWYGSTNPQSNRGKQSNEFISDKVIHAEIGGSFRKAGSTLLPKYIAAFKLATWWLVNYEAAKHNPYNMKAINPAVAADMNLYPTLFPPMPELVTTPAPMPTPEVPVPTPETPVTNDDTEEFITMVEEYVTLITTASTKLKFELVEETIRFMNYLESKRNSITAPEQLATIDKILVELSKIREAAADKEDPKEPDADDIKVEDGNAPGWEQQPNIPEPDPDYEEKDDELNNDGVVVIPPPVVIPAPVIKYAPVIASATGNIEICSVNLKWLDHPGVDANSAGISARRFAKIYNDIGGGRFTVKVTVKTVTVNFNHSATTFNAAVAEAKSIVDKAKVNQKTPYSYYVMCHTGIRSYSNATGGIAYINGTLTRNFLHEIGHLWKPTRMQHANIPDKIGADGKVTVDGEYKDPTSFMGRFSTWSANGANLYFMGCLPKEKVALFENGSVEFGIEPLYKDPIYDIPYLNVPGKDGFFKAIVLSQAGKDLILSTSQQKDPEPPVVNGKKQAAKVINLFTLHSTQGGTNEVGPQTTLLKMFKEKATYEGWSFERTAVDGNLAKLRITLTP